MVKKTDQTLLDQWLTSLPANVREALNLTSELIENFASNVQVAEALNQLAFRRAVDSTIDPDMSELDVSMRLSLALKANNSAVKLKRQRLEALRDFEGVQDAPRPINVVYTLKLTEVEDRIKRLRALGYENEAIKLEDEVHERRLSKYKAEEGVDE
jgi:hypothetical protein